MSPHSLAHFAILLRRSSIPPGRRSILAAPRSAWTGEVTGKRLLRLDNYLQVRTLTSSMKSLESRSKQQQATLRYHLPRQKYKFAWPQGAVPKGWPWQQCLQKLFLDCSSFLFIEAVLLKKGTIKTILQVVVWDRLG